MPDETQDRTQLDEASVDAFIAQLDTMAEADAAIEIRSLDRREIGIRIVPWEVPAISRAGPEVIMRGAFDGVDPTSVRLQSEEHGPVCGLGLDYENRSDGAWMTFKVSRTQRGDDLLTLVQDRVTTGASVSYQDIPDGTEIYRRAGKSLRVVHKAALRAVSTTWKPTWPEAQVQFIRTAPEGEPAMPTADGQLQPEAPAPAPIDFGPIIEAIQAQGTAHATQMQTWNDRFAEMQERSRQEIVIPGREAPQDAKGRPGIWLDTVIRMLSGERMSQDHLRSLDDIITTDNIGVVPEAFLPNLRIGVIDPRRPFLNSTRRLDLPPTGMTLNVPKIITRPETGVQAAEKDDIASNTTSITSVGYDAVTIAGGGDLSLQVLKRSGPSFLGLYLELLAESLAKNAEIQALTALYTGDTPGGTLDPENANFGQAWKHGAAVGQQVDTLWLSSVGVAEFIDAKADGTNAPLYSSIQAGFTAGSGPAGTISGLRPVYVPAMDSVGDIDAIVGPSAGFAWTEDGTYTLEVDVPAKAGRDVALVSMLWYAPLYPSAFTTYQIAS